MYDFILDKDHCQTQVEFSVKFWFIILPRTLQCLHVADILQKQENQFLYESGTQSTKFHFKDRKKRFSKYFYGG